MQVRVSEVERMLHEKIFLYRELLELFKEEAKSLMDSDLDRLWKLSGEKQAQAARIEAVRRQLLEAAANAGIDPGMDEKSFRISALMPLLPEDAARRLNPAVLTVNQLKDEIQNLARQNMDYIRQYLSVLDDLLGIITAAAEPRQGYGKTMGSPAKNRMNLLLHKEV